MVNISKTQSCQVNWRENPVKKKSMEKQLGNFKTIFKG